MTRSITAWLLPFPFWFFKGNQQYLTHLKASVLTAIELCSNFSLPQVPCSEFSPPGFCVCSSHSTEHKTFHGVDAICLHWALSKGGENICKQSIPSTFIQFCYFPRQTFWIWRSQRSLSFLKCHKRVAHCLFVVIHKTI